MNIIHFLLDESITLALLPVKRWLKDLMQLASFPFRHIDQRPQFVKNFSSAPVSEPADNLIGHKTLTSAYDGVDGLTPGVSKSDKRMKMVRHHVAS